MPNRMAKTEKKKKTTTNNTRCWQECEATEILIYIWWKCKMTQCFGRQFSVSYEDKHIMQQFTS